MLKREEVRLLEDDAVRLFGNNKYFFALVRVNSVCELIGEFLSGTGAMPQCNRIGRDLHGRGVKGGDFPPDLPR